MGVHDHVEEGSIQRDGLDVLRGRGGTGVHVQRGGGSRLGAVFVQLQIRLVEHGVDVEGVAVGRAAQSAQIGGGDIEQVADAGGAQRLLQCQLGAGGELGDGRLHVGVVMVGDHLVEVLAGEVPQVVRQRNALVGHECHKGVFPAVVGLQKPGDVVAGEVDSLVAVQIVRRLTLAAGGGENAVGADVFLGIGRLPLGIKAGGVDQIQHGLRSRLLLQQVADHAIGLFADPAVQIGDEPAVKGGAVDLRAVIVDAAAEEGVLHPERIPQPRGVRQRGLTGLTVGGQAHAVGVQEVVELVEAHAGCRLDLLERGAGGSVCHHAQRVEDGHRGEQHAHAAGAFLPQEGQGEIRHRLAAGGQVGGGVHHLRLEVRRQLLCADAAARQGQQQHQRKHQCGNAFCHRVRLLSKGSRLFRRKPPGKGFPRPRRGMAGHWGSSPGATRMILSARS